jgi:hypothetical protein
MKDIQIKGKTVKREIIILLIVFSAALALNIFSIVNYKTNWSELYKEFYIVIILTFVLYFIIWPVRLLAALLKHFIDRGKK